MQLRSLIVDDEFNCRSILKSLVQDFCPEIKVIGTAASASKAREIIAEAKPDVLFLDIRMPGEDGFSLLNSIDTSEISVVFTTAHDEYALKAFEANAIDYLTKPIDVLELKNTIGKLLKYQSDPGSHEKNIVSKVIKIMEQKNGDAVKRQIPTEHGFIMMHEKEIIHLTAEQNYTIIHLSDGKKFTSSKNIKYFDDMFSESCFFRTHRAHMINTKHHLEEFTRKGGAMAILSDGTKIPIARRKITEFLMHLNAY